MTERSERSLLLGRLENEEGTLEEQEAWLARLQDLDPHFRQFDHSLSLEDSVRLRRRVQTLREQFGMPPTREQLVALVQSIDYSRASSREDIDDLMARSELFAASVPHPEAGKLIDRVWSDGDMSAEEAVEAALAWKVPDRFSLPGAVDADWESPNETETVER
jgi:polyhydroxyalkanoate synthesis regulator phasin